MILTRKSHDCAGTTFVQGDSAGGSKLVEQTLQRLAVDIFQIISQVQFRYQNAVDPKGRNTRLLLILANV